MGRTFTTWVYTDDDGQTWNRKAPTDYTIQLEVAAVKIGGAAAATKAGTMVKSFHPRTALCQDPQGNRYRIVCYDADAPLYTTPGMTFSIYDRDGGAAITVTQIGTEGERKRNPSLTLP